MSKPKAKTLANSEVKFIRIFDHNFAADSTLFGGLRSAIKGIGRRISQQICRNVGLSMNQRFRDLNENEIQHLQDELTSLDLPDFMCNRRRDRETGETYHHLGERWLDRVREDVERQKIIKSYIGQRYIQFQSSSKRFIKVHGQNTKSNGRKRANIGIRK